MNYRELEGGWQLSWQAFLGWAEMVPVSLGNGCWNSIIFSYPRKLTHSSEGAVFDVLFIADPR